MAKRNLKANIYQDRSEKKEWRWQIVAGNGKVLAMSSEGYHNRSDCIHGLNLVLTAEPIEDEEGGEGDDS